LAEENPFQAKGERKKETENLDRKLTNTEHTMSLSHSEEYRNNDTKDSTTVMFTSRL
jgi:hypothetical protein